MDKKKSAPRKQSGMENLQLVDANDAFFIEKSKFSKSYLNDLLDSNDPKDKTMLNLIVTKIVNHDHKDSFEYLLNHGYKIDVLNDQNQTAIHLAVYNNAETILDWGSDFLLSKCANNINHTDNNGLSYLHFACMIGKKKAVKKYLDTKVDINARWYHDPQGNRNGFTPLHFAVGNHKTEIVKVLLQRGADVNSTDSLGRTPFHLACCLSEKFSKPREGDLTSHPDWNSEMKIMKLLVTQGADLNLRDKLGNTPLLSIFKNDKTCKEIKSFGEQLLEFPNMDDKSAVSLLNRQKEKLDYLMELSIDITVTNDNGENILHRIISDLKPLRFPTFYEMISFNDEFHAKLIDQLLALRCGIDIDEMNSRGESPLLRAISFISLDIVKVLLDHDADVSNLKFNYRDKNFFSYPAIPPNLKATRNLFGIIELLEGRDFKMTLQDNLAVLQFLIHEVHDCECCDINNHCSLNYNMFHAFNYGSSEHIDHVLERIQSLSTGTDFEELISVLIVNNLFLHLKLCKMAKMDYDKKSYRMSKNNHVFDAIPECDVKDKYFEACKKDLARLKSTVLMDGVTLHDLLILDIDDIYDYVKNGEKVDKLVELCVQYRHLLEGRITKSVSLTYFYESLRDYLRKLTISSLPDDCCKLIFGHLSRRDLLNACFAVEDGSSDTIDLKSLRL